jgi:8-oxo-dGTP pyrophosphatase MutT (NUDIX family)
MRFHELRVEVESRCLSVWREPWANRPARVTLLVDFGDSIVVVMDFSNGFWFLPGGGVEQGESTEDTAKREATEELGLEIRIDRIAEAFNVTLVSGETGERLLIPPFLVVHAFPAKGQLKTEYAPKRQIILVKKQDRKKLLRELRIPREYECLKPYHYISKEVVRKI